MRIRTIKPEFWKDEKLSSLEPHARLLFIGLWQLADISGRLEDRPRRIWAEVFPYEPDVDCEILLESLRSIGAITRYSFDNGHFIEIPAFTKHQRINGKEAQSKSFFPSGLEGKHLGSTGEAPEKRSALLKEKRSLLHIKEGNEEGNGVVSDSLSENPHPLPKRKMGYSESFENFWRTYPSRNGKKTGKQESWVVWNRDKLDARSGDIVSALRVQVKHKYDCDAAGVFCAEFQDPKRWLVHKRWHDEIKGVDTKPVKDDSMYWRDDKVNRLLTEDEKAAFAAEREKR